MLSLPSSFLPERLPRQSACRNSPVKPETKSLSMAPISKLRGDQNVVKRRIWSGALRPRPVTQRKAWRRPGSGNSTAAAGSKDIIHPSPKGADGFLSMFGAAINGAWREVRSTRGFLLKFKLATVFGFKIAKELLSLVTAVPYGYRALQLYRKTKTALPLHIRSADVRHSETVPTENEAATTNDQKVAGPGEAENVIVAAGEKKVGKESKQQAGSWLRRRTASTAPSIVRDVRYGERHRNVLDVYLPNGAPAGSLRPVVVFVHGGVWASGDKWQYSPLGVRCANEGIVAVLVQYSLYPEVLAEQQVTEISQALTWTMDTIQSYGGDPAKVTLMGHSSGAHICSMALWERAKTRLVNLLLPSKTTDASLPESSAAGAEHSKPATGDERQPYCFVGLAGVYDITEHYRYEESRGVAAISCLRPANGGLLGFPAMSPALLLNALACCCAPLPAAMAPPLPTNASEEALLFLSPTRTIPSRSCGALRGENSEASTALIKCLVPSGQLTTGKVEEMDASTPLPMSSEALPKKRKRAGTDGIDSVPKTATPSTTAEATDVGILGEGDAPSAGATGAEEQGATNLTEVCIYSTNPNAPSDGAADPTGPSMYSSNPNASSDGVPNPSGSSMLIPAAGQSSSTPLQEAYAASTPATALFSPQRTSMDLTPGSPPPSLLTSSCTPKSELTRHPESLSDSAAAALLAPALQSLALSEDNFLDQLRWLIQQSGLATTQAKPGGAADDEKEELFRLPPMLLLSTPSDIVVPPTTSFSMRDAVRAVGGQAKVVLYDRVNHNEFACWEAVDPKPKKVGARTRQVAAQGIGALALVEDVLDVAGGRVAAKSLNWDV
eukprot:TRINITY_DN4270_c0_g1_i1.p1 TRINITY_DN4270_c0_g1~~TRINITY_DN4270_c0_g1_i1.p1  ORF type:complete len:840 (+),score=138.57 TRINITY_DN4270_c0_g1_i1:101-2620(+)